MLLYGNVDCAKKKGKESDFLVDNFSTVHPSPPGRSCNGQLRTHDATFPRFSNHFVHQSQGERYFSTTMPQQQQKYESSAQAYPRHIRPHSYPYCANPLTALEEREIVGKLLKDGGQALTIYTVFLLSRQLRGQRRTNTISIAATPLESRNTYIILYKPQ